MDLTTDGEMRKQIGARIQKIRIQSGLKQKELAEILSITEPSYISLVENGKNGLSMEKIARFCDYFKISTDQILLGKDYPQNDVSALTARLGRLEPEYYRELEKIIDAYLRTIHLAEAHGQDADKKEIERDTAQ